VERRGPAAHNSFVDKLGRGEMTNSSVSLHELRRRIYVKAKAQTSWRFWGLYVHVCKTGTLREAYRLAKENNGAPGIDGVSFEAIEEQGVVSFVEHLRKELIDGTYRPLRARKVGIPKDGGKTRVLSIPAIRDRVVQGALKLILEPINPILRGWVNYFAVGHSSRCFSFIRLWVAKKLRRHLERARQRKGFGWKRWSQRWLYETLGLFNDYRVRYLVPSWDSGPTG